MGRPTLVMQLLCTRESLGWVVDLPFYRRACPRSIVERADTRRGLLRLIIVSEDTSWHYLNLMHVSRAMLGVVLQVAFGGIDWAPRPHTQGDQSLERRPRLGQTSSDHWCQSVA